jgi:hypothetical protein
MFKRDIVARSFALETMPTAAVAPVCERERKRLSSVLDIGALGAALNSLLLAR